MSEHSCHRPSSERLDAGLEANRLRRLDHEAFCALLTSRLTLDRLPESWGDGPGLVDPATGVRYVLVGPERPAVSAGGSGLVN